MSSTADLGNRESQAHVNFSSILLLFSPHPGVVRNLHTSAGAATVFSDGLGDAGGGRGPVSQTGKRCGQNGVPSGRCKEVIARGFVIHLGSSRYRGFRSGLVAIGCF